ncbi:MAG: hypothetical protein H6830_07275 [Planctomycetes bacterium]|nr:hypothetical protein [Planctomycetota bacterium]MCB9910200.1 hypothetical protein [Planctomycetota bacterium]HPF14850.1 hypothetical protein [Planctomycetota bacterium]
MNIRLRNPHRHGSQTGLSLVEIMIAVGISTVLLMATAATFFGNMKAVNQARSLTSATIFLETIREDLLAQPYANLLALNGNSFFDGDTQGQSHYRADLTVFQAQVGLLQLRISLVDMNTNAELGRLVTVRSQS